MGAGKSQDVPAGTKTARARVPGSKEATSNDPLKEFAHPEHFCRLTSTEVSLVLQLDRLVLPPSAQGSRRPKSAGQEERILFVQMYTRAAHEPSWRESTRTEEAIYHVGQGLQFLQRMNMTFCMENGTFLRFEVYAKLNGNGMLEDQQYVGGVNAVLLEILLALRVGSGWHVMDLTNQYGKSVGKFGAYGEEEYRAKFALSFELYGLQIPTADPWKGRPDAYCAFYGDDYTQKNGLRPISRTRVARKSSDPFFGQAEILAGQVWPRGPHHPMMVEVRDWFRVSGSRLLGQTWIRHEDIMMAFRTSLPLTVCIYQVAGGEDILERQYCTVMIGSDGEVDATPPADAAKPKRPTKKVGYLQLRDVQATRTYTFLDFLRGGMAIKLMVAIDLSRSGSKQSLHSALAIQQGTNFYCNVIKALGSNLARMDDDNKFPVFGLGARLPPSYSTLSDCFCLTGDFLHPEVEGVDGIIEAYEKALKIVSLHGPTHLSPMVKHAKDCASCYIPKNPGGKNQEQQLSFYVLLMLTDGDISADDSELLIEELASLDNVPLHVVILGIGSGNFEVFGKLAESVKTRRRERGVDPVALKNRAIVRFIALGADLSTEIKAFQAGKDALDLVSGECIFYFNGKNVKPNLMNEFEDEAGKPRKPPKDMFAKSRPDSALPEKSKIGGSRLPTKSNSSETNAGKPKSKKYISWKVNDEDSDDKEDHPDFHELQRMYRYWDYLPMESKMLFRRLMKETRAIGYALFDIEKIFRRGIPAADMDCFTDAMMHIDNPDLTYAGMLNFGQTLHRQLNLGGVILQEDAMVILHCAIAIIHCDRMSLAVFDQDQGCLKLYAPNLSAPISLGASVGIGGHVFTSGKTLMVPDAYKDYRFDRTNDEKTFYTTRSMLAVPVITPVPKCVGVVMAINRLDQRMNLNPKNPKQHLSAIPFHAHDQVLMEDFARSIGAQVQSGTCVVDELITPLLYAKQLRLLRFDVPESFISQEEATQFASTIAELSACERFSLWAYDHEAKELVLSCSTDFSPNVRTSITKGLVGRVFRDVYPVIIHNCYEDPDFDPYWDEKTGFKTTSMLCVPILGSGGKSLGVLQAINRLPDAQKTRLVVTIEFRKADMTLMAKFSELLTERLESPSFNAEALWMTLNAAFGRRIARPAVVPGTIGGALEQLMGGMPMAPVHSSMVPLSSMRSGDPFGTPRSSSSHRNQRSSDERPNTSSSTRAHTAPLRQRRILQAEAAGPPVRSEQPLAIAAFDSEKSEQQRLFSASSLVRPRAAASKLHRKLSSVSSVPTLPERPGTVTSSLAERPGTTSSVASSRGLHRPVRQWEVPVLEATVQTGQNEQELISLRSRLGTASADGRCRVCLLEPTEVMFVPCGHQLVCKVCSDFQGPKCLLCGAIIVEKQLYLHDDASRALYELAHNKTPARGGKSLGSRPSTKDRPLSGKTRLRGGTHGLLAASALL